MTHSIRTVPQARNSWSDQPGMRRPPNASSSVITQPPAAAVVVRLGSGGSSVTSETSSSRLPTANISASDFARRCAWAPSSASCSAGSSAVWPVGTESILRGIGRPSRVPRYGVLGINRSSMVFSRRFAVLKRFALAFVALLAAPAAAPAAELGTPTLDRPTPAAIGIRVPLTGDDDRDASATVRYQAVGERDWHPAPPLFRVQPEDVRGGGAADELAGSVFGLRPGTVYGLEVHVTEPDFGL